MVTKTAIRTKWIGIITRVDGNPYYKHVEMCEEWRDVDVFGEWFKEQDRLGFFQKGWHIDKDLLSPKGKKIYSPETCVFLPPKINLAITNQPEVKDDPFYLDKSIYYNYYYQAYQVKRSAVGGKDLGLFHTKEKASEAYRNYRINKVKDLANFYKEHIPELAYQKLMEWEPE